MILPASRALTIALVVLGAGAARAELGSTWKPMGSVDYLGAGNAGKHNKDGASGWCAGNLARHLVTACSYDVTSYGAIGGRIGAVYSSPKSYAGASVGYYYGGPTAGRTNLAVTPTGAADSRTIDRTARFLLEDGYRFDLGEGWGVALGAAAGLALVHETMTCSDSGSLACVLARDDLDRGWPTWEAGPALLNGPFELAVRYVGFARHHAVPWTTFGISAGFRF